MDLEKSRYVRTHAPTHRTDSIGPFGLQPGTKKEKNHGDWGEGREAFFNNNNKLWMKKHFLGEGE